jgi:hypothetical protein
MSEDGQMGLKSLVGKVVSERGRSEIMGMSTVCACVNFVCMGVSEYVRPCLCEVKCVYSGMYACEK